LRSSPAAEAATAARSDARDAGRGPAHPDTAPALAHERWNAGLLLAALIALRVLYAFHYEFDSDEPQHLHVVWAWTRGLLPYRDVLDNHAPLFHLLMAPLLSAIGERPEALVAMRFAMFPLFATVLLAVAALGRRLWSPRVGLWAAVLAAAWPQHFLTSLEFRADDLWAALWLLSLVVLFGGPPTARRCGSAGLLAGAALGVSLKTALLVFGLGLALTAAWPAARRQGAQATRAVGAWVAGFVLVPAALAVLFAGLGTLPALVRATVFGNALQGLWSGPPLRCLWFPLGLPVAFWIARRLPGEDPRGTARAVLFLSGAVAYLALVSFWPLVTPQDYLPLEPLAALTIAALVVPAGAAAARRSWRWLAAPALSVAAIVMLLMYWPAWSDRTVGPRTLIADVLALTRDDETVMDLKGESVFRRRPVFWVLESVTQERFRRGLMRDQITAELRAAHTAVAAPDHHRLPPGIREFLNANYISVGAVRVLGMRLTAPAGASAAAATPNAPAADAHPPASPGVPGAIPFEIELPERYELLAGAARGRGRLDGAPLDGPRWLAAGLHRYVPAAGEREWTVVWARAVEKGYIPPPRNLESR
jgi:hypothetical protein